MNKTVTNAGEDICHRENKELSIWVYSNFSLKKMYFYTLNYIDLKKKSHFCYIIKHHLPIPSEWKQTTHKIKNEKKYQTKKKN